jgi:hypothetical protein
VVARNLGYRAAEGPLTRPDHPTRHSDAVRLGDSGCVIERPAKSLDLDDEVRVERELLRHHERGHEHDACAAIGSEAAGEVERVLGLGLAEKRHDDAAIADGSRAPGKAPRVTAYGANVRASHHNTWYGTLARMTPGSRRRRRLTYNARWLCSSRLQPRVTSSGMTRSTAVSSSAVSSRR